MIKRGTMLLGLLFMPACVRVALAPEAQKVRVTANPDAVKGCRSLGLVKGADHWQGGMIGQGAASDNATTRLRNETAKLGGNVVFFLTKQTNKAGSSAEGEAYKCTEAGQ